METFGQKLKQVVRSRGLKLEDVARETGFDIHTLEALERDDLEALGVDEDVTAGLRAFARVVEVDPDQVIDDYRREQASHRHPEPDDSTIVSEAREAPDHVMTEPPRSARSSLLALALATSVLVLAVAAVLWLARGDSMSTDRVSRSEAPVAPKTTPQPLLAGDRGSSTRASRADASATRGKQLTPAGGPSSSAPAQGAASRSSASQPVVDGDKSGMTIAEQGVGIGVRDRELIGAATRFAEGTSVWFWTRIEGATPGETIHHVWLREGEEVASVPLMVGGATWRTQSSKNLQPGSAGDWVVEARDGGGNVLARRAFQVFGSAAD